MSGSPLQPTGARRSNYDVTNTVCVSAPDAVRRAVQELFQSTYPSGDFDPLWLAFYDFERLFAGGVEGYAGCETCYHDRQHTLDMVLAMARLIQGYEAAVEPGDRLGPQRAVVGLITALFHDAGYIRHLKRDAEVPHGAVFTPRHVSRSAHWLRDYLPRLGLSESVPIATRLVHYTGYEVNLDEYELDDPRDCILGHLLGTADLMAQMADRCYLEKCRDYLFLEFVLGGLALIERPGAGIDARYRSGRDLLAQTPRYYEETLKPRLTMTFNRAYRYMELLFEEDPYALHAQRNLEHLERVIREDRWDLLRRSPPCFAALDEAPERLRGLARERVHELERRYRVRLADV